MTQLVRCDPDNARLARIIYRIKSTGITLHYIKGAKNLLADALSRYNPRYYKPSINQPTSIDDEVNKRKANKQNTKSTKPTKKTFNFSRLAYLETREENGYHHVTHNVIIQEKPILLKINISRERIKRFQLSNTYKRVFYVTLLTSTEKDRTIIELTPKTTNLIAIPKNARMRRFAYQQEMEFVKFNPQAKQPTRVTEGSAGYDLYSYQRVEIPPGEIRHTSSFKEA